ncbi:MAG: hypothetical protein U5K53_02790 [Halanaerobiales bacterium]|nr:hypothetical protein [Halanaerobiales bacterium]
MKKIVKMSINLKFVKKFAAEKIFKQALTYLEKDPERNFIKILNLMDKTAVTDAHHQHIEKLKKFIKSNQLLDNI